MKQEDGIDLDPGDFRAHRRYLAPWLFAVGNDEDTYPPPTDLVTEDRWDGVMVLPTDVVLKSTSYEGSLIDRIQTLQTDWVFSWPDLGAAPFMEEASLLAGDEFAALVFNAAHGYYRQGIGCLRNALEILFVAAGLAVTRNKTLFTRWRDGDSSIEFGQARAWLRDSRLGRQVDSDATPNSVFGDTDGAWAKGLYARLCRWAHGRGGYNNGDFWESNGPVFSPRALLVVEAEFRETLALAYLVLRLGWPSYEVGPGEPKLLAGHSDEWTQHLDLLRKWLSVA